MFELTLEGPGKNCLGSEMLRFILDGLAEAAGRPILLRGHGDAFSAGLNLKEVGRLEPDAMRGFLELLERCFVSLFLYPGPTVAVVGGHAIAGGCVLALCCDHRVATTNPRARIGLNEVALGLRFPPMTMGIVRARVPLRHLNEVVLGAGLLAPERALALGLVDELADDPEAVGRTRLATLAAHPADAYRLAKHDLRGRAPEDVATPAASERWVRESLSMWTSDVVRQKIAAALAR
ncbi:MAG: enoyl-CoA hydratase/isomerase family protein [Deltaproteobacteria bacterium]|nr:enoyl-CoA hydratase/isomerase family protein [Deltaproteobacteria bacterium]